VLTPEILIETQGSAPPALDLLDDHCSRRRRASPPS
jgi:hypothetical protein